MSQGEVDRLGVIQSVVDKRLKQREAAEQLGLSVRQIKRLVARYREHGAQGLVSRHRGKRPGNAIQAAVREQALRVLGERYEDFSPCFAHEKLCEVHGFGFSVETLRQWMIVEGVWKAKPRKQARVHQRRPRRPCRGGVQIDGSPHDWFEGRGPRCTLIVFIDDATSPLQALRFAPAESTEANQTLQDRLVKELRLLGIDDIEAANAYLPTFIKAYNARFAVAPGNPGDAHRAVLHSAEELAQVFSLHHSRTLSKQLTVQFKNREYQIQTKGQGYGLRGAVVTVCEPFDGPVTILRKGHALPWRLLAEGEPPIPVDDEKSVHERVERAKAKAPWKPAPDHPWNKKSRAAAEQAGLS